MRNILVTLLVASLLMPAALAFQPDPTPAHAASAPASSPASSSAQNPASSQQPQTSQPQSTRRNGSYSREAHARQSGISKSEKLFLVAIAATSIAVGAIAGGGEGVAIGAIVGGWGAYVGHRLWKWLK